MSSKAQRGLLACSLLLFSSSFGRAQLRPDRPPVVRQNYIGLKIIDFRQNTPDIHLHVPAFVFDLSSSCFPCTP
jgi:hypothetical protein